MGSFKEDFVETDGASDLNHELDKYGAFLNGLEDAGLGEPTDLFAQFSRSFEFRQVTPSLEWVIEHDLNAYPKVVVILDNGTRLGGQVDYPDLNTVVVSFGHLNTGIARLST